MREFISKLLRYAMTGGIAAVVDAGFFALLLDAKLSILVASVFSFCTAAFVNYRLTSQFVFGRDVTLHGFALFLSAALIGLSVNIGMTLLAAYALGLPPIAAKLAGIATAFFVNFLLNLRVVFHIMP